VANFVSQTPILSDIAKWLGGIAPQRRMPPFARQTFRAWFRQRQPLASPGSPQVLLWPDTFNNFFHPEVASAGTEVLEAAGYQVVIPDQSLCCGRPLYDFGMLDTAKQLLREILDSLRPHIEAGTPIVVLEPSCAAVFRDELVNLFPSDEDAQRLKKQTYLLSEFLNQYAVDFHPPKLGRRAVLHGHCHHKSLMGMEAEEAWLTKLGVEFQTPEQGCCGMAGSFGFERDHYEISTACGERALLPAVRDASPGTLVIADGFSCQEQILQGTSRRPLHLAQVIQMAMRDSQELPRRGFRNDIKDSRSSEQEAGAVPVLVLCAGSILGGAALAWLLNRRQS
jgi:Fe-S oxidoreductase